MLPRQHRLTQGSAIAEISRRGGRARSGDIVVSARRTASDDVRAAVVVGKRAGGAVARNRQRRRLQHALAEVVPHLPGGIELVVRGGPDVAALTSAELTAALDATTRRAVSRGQATQ
jgi:ribonuclease P protein component